MNKLSKTRSILATAAIGAGLMIGMAPASAAPIDGAGEVTYRPFHDFDGDGVFSEGDRIVMGGAIQFSPISEIIDPDGDDGPIVPLPWLHVFHRLDGRDSDGKPQWDTRVPDSEWMTADDAAPGDYKATWALPEGCEPTTLPKGFEADDEPITEPDTVRALTVASGTITVVAGESIDISLPVNCEPTSLTGVVFNDTDGSGAINGDEQPVSGAVVTLDGVTGPPWNPEAVEELQEPVGLPLTLSGTSDEAGVYGIDDLTEGAYALGVTVPDNCSLGEGVAQGEEISFAYGDQTQRDIPLTCTDPIDPPTTETTVPTTDTTVTEPTATTAPVVIPVVTPPVDQGGNVQVNTGDASGSGGLVTGVGGAVVLATALGAAIMLRRRTLAK